VGEGFEVDHSLKALYFKAILLLLKSRNEWPQTPND